MQTQTQKKAEDDESFIDRDKMVVNRILPPKKATPNTATPMMITAGLAPELARLAMMSDEKV